jgi:cell division protein FtsL
MAAAATAGRAAPARAPARRKAPARRPGGQLIPIAVGTATAVRHLPDSSLMVRLTRGRVWIGVLGVLLAGIVAVNVLTLSLAASAGHIDRNIQALDQENSNLGSRAASLYGSARVRHDAGSALGLALPTTDQIGYVQAGPDDVAVAAQRLAAAGSAY